MTRVIIDLHGYCLQKDLRRLETQIASMKRDYSRDAPLEARIDFEREYHPLRKRRDVLERELQEHREQYVVDLQYMLVPIIETSKRIVTVDSQFVSDISVVLAGEKKLETVQLHVSTPGGDLLKEYHPFDFLYEHDGA